MLVGHISSISRLSNTFECSLYGPLLFCSVHQKLKMNTTGKGWFFFRKGLYRNMLKCSLRNHETSINLILAFLFRPFGFYCSQRFQNYFSNLRVPDEGDFRNASGALNLISEFLFGVYMIIVKNQVIDAGSFESLVIIFDD